jgi:hypothetical protein
MATSESFEKSLVLKIKYIYFNVLIELFNDSLEIFELAQLLRCILCKQRVSKGEGNSAFPKTTSRAGPIPRPAEWKGL